MLFDVRTIVMLAALVALLVGACLLFAVRGFGGELRQCLSRWAGGVVLQSVGWCLLGLRGNIPDVLSIVLANGLLALGYAECVQALRAFAGSPGRLRLSPYVPVGAMLVVAAVFTFTVPDLSARVLLLSTLYLALFALQLSAVYAAGPRPRPVSHALMLGLCWYAIAVLVLRLVAERFAHEPLYDAFAYTPVQVLVFATGAFGPALASLAFVLMASDRVSGELRRLAMVDPLTETWNRRSMDEQAARLLAESRRHRRKLALLLVDADHFKRINDTWGHAVGDEALQALVRVLGAHVRTEDLIGRLGGEEFVVLMPGTGEEAGAACAERLRAAVEATRFRFTPGPVSLEVSIGVAEADAGEDFHALIRRADRALYEAKHRGRNRVVAASTLDAAETRSA